MGDLMLGIATGLDLATDGGVSLRQCMAHSKAVWDDVTATVSTFKAAIADKSPEGVAKGFEDMAVSFARSPRP